MTKAAPHLFLLGFPSIVTFTIFADSETPPNLRQLKLVNDYISALQKNDLPKLKSLYHPNAFNCAREKNNGRKYNERFYSSLEIEEKLSNQIFSYHQSQTVDMNVNVRKKGSVDPENLLSANSKKNWSEEQIKSWVEGVRSLPFIAHSSQPPTHELWFSFISTELVTISTVPIVEENNKWYLTFYCIKHGPI